MLNRTMTIMENEEFSGFYKLTPEQRLAKVKKAAKLTEEEAKTLQNSGALSMERADKTVENVIGAVHLPLGLATHFRINKKDRIIPMAMEESSVIAAACKAAKQALPEGFTADADESVMIGQIQLVGIKNTDDAVKGIEAKRKEIMSAAIESMKPHEKYGCGVRGFECKQFKSERGGIVVVDFFLCVGDAQGANMINTALEKVAPIVEKSSGGKVRLRIISNLATKRKARASAVWKKEVVGEEVIEAVLDAYEFAKCDVYRCATHNKGVMNGISAVAVATGNDWRSVEAGAHSFAALGGYHPLTSYTKNKNGDLVGSIELPLAVATVGPAINSSPTARIALKIIGTTSSRELAMAMACVGLANNFAALAALGTVGIQQGHMKLHARNIAAYAGATGNEVDQVAERISKEKNFDIAHVKSVVEEVRKLSGGKKKR